MRRLVFFVVAAVAAILLYQWLTPRWVLAPGKGGPPSAPEKFTPATEPRIDPREVPGLAALDAEYTKLVSSVVPSVVSVTSTRTVKVPVADLSDYLFGWRGRVMDKPESSLGSGVVVSKEGHILTNHHVVAGMHDIQVQLTDGRELPATLIGSDPNVDIAVLKVDAPGLPPLPLSDSDQVRVGQMVMAVGNPFGLQESVTRGIVSAKGRALRDSGVEFFQTDAAVNPGNSGGPLLNMKGEIIGINSAIYSQSGAWAGISFAIPANVARQTMESILKSGRPTRGTLGVNMISLSPALAQRLGLRDPRGVYVADVEAGSPAERVGVQRGDVIHSFNGQIVSDANDLRDRIAAAGVGAKVQVGVVRGGREQVVQMEIVQMPNEPTPSMLPPKKGSPAAANNVLFGLKVQPVAPNNAAGIRGMLVNGVTPGTPAATSLQEGDVILEVNRIAVPSQVEWDAAVLALQPGQRALLRVVRGQQVGYVALSP